MHSRSEDVRRNWSHNKDTLASPLCFSDRRIKKRNFFFSSLRISKSTFQFPVDVRVRFFAFVYSETVAFLLETRRKKFSYLPCGQFRVLSAGRRPRRKQRGGILRQRNFKHLLPLDSSIEKFSTSLGFAKEGKKRFCSRIDRAGKQRTIERTLILSVTKVFFPRLK